MKQIKINEKDNVAVMLEGELSGHKIALNDIKKGENIIKYGYPIGHATEDIKKGDHIHTHNIKTNLSGVLEYKYEPQRNEIPKTEKRTFMGYRRADGKVGIRNEIWIVNTVGCVNKTSEILAREANKLYGDMCDGVFNYVHPFGCSQLGDDQKMTQNVLKGLVNHPNATGVLVLGLGCENNNISVFKTVLGEVDENRVKFMSTQDFDDEIGEGLRLIGELAEYAKNQKREECDVSELVVGLKCGGSDGFSGLTANPLIGRFSDKLISKGGSTVLTEVPEMFGAETILMNRCVNEEVFDKTVSLINDFKDLTGPGNDIVAVTNLTASGCHLILFSTGRGTPVGAPVPTVKIATNTNLAKRKPHWIDFNAGEIINGADLTDELFEYVIEVANGKQTNNEKNGYKEISIFKDGVVL